MIRLVLGIVVILTLLAACEKKPEKQRRKIAHATIFIFPDTTEEDLAKLHPINLDTSYVEYVFKAYNLVDIKTLDSTILVQLQYADTTNFLKKNMYDGLRKAYFTCETALRVAAAQYYLKQIHPHYSLVIYDASRPLHIQQMMWDSLDLPPLTKLSYLSNPQTAGMHNYGCAVDCSIIDTQSGMALDMGTGYDEFSKLSQPVLEYHFLQTKELSKESYENRRLLRYVMRRAKLNSINTEWWHFSAVSADEALSNYQLIK